MKFRARPVVVRAEQFNMGNTAPSGVRYNPKASPEAKFTTPYGEVVLTSGDWIVTYASGRQVIYPEQAFKDEFEKVEE